jgi:HSP20 family protein
VVPVPDPTRKPRKEDDNPFGDLFADFDREFRRMQEQMNQLFEAALRNADVPKGPMRPGNPFMYGFTLRLGPDGRPHIEHFGNTPAARPEVAVEGGRIEGGREPVTDLIEHPDHFSITMELPGIEKEDVQVFATEERLTLKVDTATRRYYKEVGLPAKVVPESCEATFKNGVLDVTLQKRETRSPPERGHRVNVK